MSKESTRQYLEVGRKFLFGETATEVPVWVPSALLFHRREELSSAPSSASSWRQQLEDLVERTSPLGLEQTRWGYCPAGPKTALIDMTSTRSLQQEGLEGVHDENRKFWYPGWVAMTGQPPRNGRWRLLLEPTCITAAWFPPSQPHPDYVISRYLPAPAEDLDPGEIQGLVDGLRPAMDKHQTGDIGPLRKVGQSKVNGDGSRLDLIVHRWDPEARQWGGPEERCIRTDVLQTANLRPLSSGEKRQIEEARFNRYAWWSFLGLSAASMLLLLLLGFTYLKAGSNERLDRFVSGRADRVKAIEESERELSYLRSLRQDRANPFDWLLVINAHRPSPLIFESFNIKEGREITIRGTASQPAQVTTLRDRLIATEDFDNVEPVTGRSDRAGTQFSMTMETRRIRPLWQPEAPEETGEEDEDDDDSTPAGEQAVSPPMNQEEGGDR